MVEPGVNPVNSTVLILPPSTFAPDDWNLAALASDEASVFAPDKAKLIKVLAAEVLLAVVVTPTPTNRKPLAPTVTVIAWAVDRAV